MADDDGPETKIIDLDPKKSFRDADPSVEQGRSENSLTVLTEKWEAVLRESADVKTGFSDLARNEGLKFGTPEFDARRRNLIGPVDQELKAIREALDTKGAEVASLIGTQVWRFQKGNTGRAEVQVDPAMQQVAAQLIDIEGVHPDWVRPFDPEESELSREGAIGDFALAQTRLKLLADMEIIPTKAEGWNRKFIPAMEEIKLEAS